MNLIEHVPHFYSAYIMVEQENHNSMNAATRSVLIYLSTWTTENLISTSQNKMMTDKLHANFLFFFPLMYFPASAIFKTYVLKATNYC